MKDINNNTPELYLCTTNRTGGKTTYFSRLLVNRWMKYREKFMLVYRYNYELDDIADKFFKDIKGLFFNGWEMTSERRAKCIYHDLLLHPPGSSPEDAGIPCGYAVSLNSVDAIKKYSHMFSDVARMFMDEFQSETNHYCTDEVKKFISLHTSVARGQGKQVRYVPVYMTGNTVSLLNPYYIALGIPDRLRENTNFLKGDGYVLEQGYVESASEAQKSSAFNRAFAKSDYIAYSTHGVYLNDNKAFIEKPEGVGRYVATIRVDGTDYALREYMQSGYMYCDNKPDLTFPFRISVTTEDHDINYVMLKAYSGFVDTMRSLFNKGCFRFKNLQSKNAILKLLSY